MTDYILLLQVIIKCNFKDYNTIRIHVSAMEIRFICKVKKIFIEFFIV